MGSAAPLMTLRDLLELACESSCSDGFRSYPRRLLLPCPADDEAPQAKAADADVPVRLLIKAGLRRSPSRTLSSILFPRSPGPGSVATISRLTRSLSRRLVFWRRHRGEDDNEGIWSGSDERDSLGLPSPVVSSCSASECSEHAESVAEAADPPVPEEQQSEKPSPSTSSGCAESADDGAAAGDGPKALDGDHPVGSSLVSMEDTKQQLSPISVMDFPFHDEDDGDEQSDAGTCSPSFQHDLERPISAQELLPHKIRRLDVLVAQGVDPVDLEPRFLASDESGPSASDDTQTQTDSSTDHDSTATTTSTAPSESDEQRPSADDGEIELDEHHHHRLLARLLKDDGGGAAAASEERLLLDFLAEGLGRLRELKAGPVVGAVRPSDHDSDEAALVRAAEEWVRGGGTRWGVEDVLFAGPAALADMDRERRWLCVGDEEREVGAAVEGLVLDALVAELVCDMAVR